MVFIPYYSFLRPKGPYVGLEGVGHKPPKIAGKISGVTYIMGWKQNKTKQKTYRLSKKKIKKSCSLHSPKMICSTHGFNSNLYTDNSQIHYLQLNTLS